MGMGIFGAVFATGASPVISIIMMLPHWLRKKNTFCLIKTGLRKDIIKQDLSLGFPSLIAQLSSGITMITFNALILKLAGNTGVAAYGIVANISLVTVAVYTGIAQGIQPLVSTFYGARNHRQAKTMLKYALITMLSVSAATYLLIFVLAQPITAVFNSENNIKLKQISETGLKVYFSPGTHSKDGEFIPLDSWYAPAPAFQMLGLKEGRGPLQVMTKFFLVFLCVFCLGFLPVTESVITPLRS